MPDPWDDDLFAKLAANLGRSGIDLMLIVREDGEALLTLTDSMPRLEAVDVLRQAGQAMFDAADAMERDEVRLLAEVKIKVDE